MQSININLQPKQGVFWDMLEASKATVLGYGGSRGGAKSGAIRRAMIQRRLKYPKTAGQILRRVWDDVLKNHVNKMWEEFPALHEYYRAAEHVILLPNGSRIHFDSAETAGDVERKSFGPEYMDIFVDQAEQFSEDELVKIKTTCRWPNTPMHQCKYGLFFNPGGQGAAYLQRVFYTKEYHDGEKQADYAFLQAYGWDNIEWARQALLEDGYVGDCFGKGCKKCAVCVYYGWSDNKRFQYYTTRTQYGTEMNKLPAHLRAGQLLGDFKKFAGQYFSNFDEAVHVWPLNSINFQDYWPRWISIDWGFTHHTVVLWHAQVGTVKDGKERPLVITYREMIRQGRSERALAEEICDLNGKEKIGAVWAGHDLWNKESHGSTKERAISQVFRYHGLPALKKAVIDRVDGWRHMYTALDEGEWIITDNCVETVRAIPQGIYNEKELKKNEDMLKTSDLGDDVRDCARYGLYSQSRPENLPDHIQLSRNVAHLDPTNRAIHAQKLQSIMKDTLTPNRSLSRYERYAGRHGR